MTAAGMTRRTALLGALASGACAAAARAADATPRALRQPALKVARPTQAVLQAITRAGDGKRLVAVGERGLAVYSDDAGHSWTQAQVPVSCTLTALRFADARRGWAVGHMGVVLATEDGGASWRSCLDGQQAAGLALQAAQAQQARSGTATVDGEAQLDDAQRLVDEGPDKPLLDLALRPDGSLWVVGAYGLALRSADGGRSWQSQMHRLPNPDRMSLYGLIERRGESFLYGEQGLLLCCKTTTDAFDPEASPTQGSLFGALALRDGGLLLLGLRGKVWRSAGPGQPWRVVNTPVDAALVSALQLPDARVLLAGSAGQLLQSHDGGEHVEVLALPRRFPFTGLAQADDGALLLTGMRGLLRLSPAELKAARLDAPRLMAARKSTP